MAVQSNEKLEKQINAVYRQHRWLAERFHFMFNRPVVSIGGRPNVVFLGNHSAGKSTFINFLLGGEAAVQDTGVAPTDDGFTVVIFGETETDYMGPAALPHLSDDFRNLERLGPSFLRRLRVKVRNRPILKRVNLIDSPGMIDAGHAKAQRDYDFKAAVSSIAEISDLVLFLFDPDKPGTTGEAITIVKECLTGMEFKLRILMNKADTFDSMYDFARAYGALCWNLARVLHSKDLPPVYTTYVPVAGTESSSLKLGDFDRYRSDVIEQVQAAPQRRADNMIASLRDDMSRLAMHVRVLTAAKQRVFWLRVRQSVSTVLWAVLGGVLAVTVLSIFSESGPWLQGVVGVTVALAVGGVLGWNGHRQYKRFRDALYGNLDPVFEEEYVKSLASGQCDDLLACWRSVRERLPGILRKLEADMPLGAGMPLRRLERALKTQIATLKADILD